MRQLIYCACLWTVEGSSEYRSTQRKQTRGGSANSAHEAPETDEQPLPNYVQILRSF